MSRPIIQRVPQQREKGPEKDLDRLLEYSMQMAFPGRFMIRHSQTDKTYKLGTGYNVGEPDYVGHLLGIYLCIENKVHPNGPTDQQLAWLRRVNQTGGLGLLLMQDKDGSFYMAMPPNDSWTFSWRYRTGWFPVPVVQFEGQRPYLDLSVLLNLVRAHFARLQGVLS